MKVIVYDKDTRYRSLSANEPLQLFISAMALAKISLHLFLPQNIPDEKIDRNNFINSMEGFEETGYECILVYNLESYIHALKTFRSLPIFFIASSSKPENQPFNHPRLLRVFNISPHPPEHYSVIIPGEFSKNIPVVPRTGFLKRTASDRIRYILDIDRESFNIYNVCTILKAVNCFENIQLTIRCSQDIWSIVKRISKPDTNFEDISLPRKADPHINAAITIGLSAAHHILSGVFVIPIGNHGSGTVVLPENVLEYAKDGFRGRIGGYQGEYVPFKLVLAEISYCNSYISGKNQFQIDTCKILAGHFSQIENDLKKEFGSCLHFWKKLQQRKIRPMIPKFVQGVTFKKNNTGNYNIYCPFKSIVGELGPEEYSVLKHFDGKKKNSEIIKLFSSSSSEVLIDFIITLYNKRAITLI